MRGQAFVENVDMRCSLSPNQASSPATVRNGVGTRQLGLPATGPTSQSGGFRQRKRRKLGKHHARRRQHRRRLAPPRRPAVGTLSLNLAEFLTPASFLSFEFLCCLLKQAAS
eukprot:scaffold334_cov241-Pinguiococcus_pyrenoidosus.AAC.25